MHLYIFIDRSRLARGPSELAHTWRPGVMVLARPGARNRARSKTLFTPSALFAVCVTSLVASSTEFKIGFKNKY